MVTVCHWCRSIVISPSYLVGQAIRCPNCSREIQLVQKQVSEEQVREYLSAAAGQKHEERELGTTAPKANR